MFIYELSGCGFEFCCSHLNFRFCTCFEQGVSWHSGNYRVWIDSETRMWHDKNIQSVRTFHHSINLKYLLQYEFASLLIFSRSKFCSSLIDHLYKYQKVPTSGCFLYKLSIKGVIAKIIHEYKVKPHSKLKSKLIHGNTILYLHLITHISHQHKSDRLKKTCTYQ